MEKITVYFKSGDFIEFNDGPSHIISSNNLLITYKSTENNDTNEPLLVTTTKLFSLDSIDKIVKINKTRKFEEHVSNK